MRSSFENLAQQAAVSVRHWWLMLLSGIATIILGIVIIYYQAESYTLLSIFFGAAILFSGLMQLFLSIVSENYFVRRGWVAVMGFLDILIGLILILDLAIAELALPYIFGAWLLYKGMQSVSLGSEMRVHQVSGGAWIVLAGILTVVLSLLVLLFPLMLGTSFLVVFMGISFVFYGLSEIVIAINLKELHKSFIEEEDPEDSEDKGNNKEE